MNPTIIFSISRKLIRRIHITRIGWAFIGITLAIGIAGLNTGNNLLYLIFGMLLSMLISNAILSSSSLHNLEAQFYFPQRLYVGSNNPVKIVLCNKKKKLPSFALTLIPENGANSFFIFKIGASESETFVHYQKFLQRGRHRLPQFKLLTSYPFGLIEKLIPITLKETRVIYPALTRLQQSLISSSSFRGEYLSGDRGVGVNPYGIREYQFGDEVRLLHWPSFAKIGKWMVKEFEQEKKSQVTIHLLVCREKPRDAKLNDLRERAICLAASVLMHFIEENRQVGLMINNLWIAPQAGSGYIDFFLTTLALFDTDPDFQNNLSTTAKRSHSVGTILAIHDSSALSATHRYDVMLPAAMLSSMEIPT